MWLIDYRGFSPPVFLLLITFFIIQANYLLLISRRVSGLTFWPSFSDFALTSKERLWRLIYLWITLKNEKDTFIGNGSNDLAIMLKAKGW